MKSTFLPGSLPGALAPGLQLLSTSYAYAHDLGRPTWDFAVEIGQLRTQGWTNTDLRWLLAHRYAEQAIEVEGGDERRFRKSNGLSFGDASCFVLTEVGAVFARGVVAKNGHPGPTRPMPHWDAHKRELLVGPQVIKRFQKLADSQAIILAAFEEQDWDGAIDDPLPPRPGIDPKRRLRQTITNLNRRLYLPLIHFFGDGTGQKVGWQWRG